MFSLIFLFRDREKRKNEENFNKFEMNDFRLFSFWKNSTSCIQILDEIKQNT